MKKLALVLLILSVETYAGVVPRINCVGSIYDKKLQVTSEIEEEKFLAEYHNGGAAFYNTFLAEAPGYNFIAIIKKMNPIKDFETAPLTLGIVDTKNYKTLIEKNVILLADGRTEKAEVRIGDKVLTFSCNRLRNP